MLAQGVFEHFLIARLEDMKRQESVRKKKRPGEGHDRDFPGQVDGLVHDEAKEYLPECGAQFGDRELTGDPRAAEVRVV